MAKAKAPQVEEVKDVAKQYVVTQFFMDAVKSGVSYRVGDTLPSDIPEDRIKNMLYLGLIKEK